MEELPLTSTPEFRAVDPAEHEEVMALWLAVWGDDGRAYFRAYLEGDPWYQDRYCRVAKVNGRVVSAAMVCRRPLRLGARELTMGGIANVATLRDYRRFGYSGELLRQCVQVMEEEGFDFSALGTGYYRHYERHGWSRVSTSTYALALEESASFPPSDPDIQPLSVGEWLAEAPPVYAAYNANLPLCFERSLEYWNGWMRIRSEGWSLDRTALLGLRREGILEGYLLGELPEQPDGCMEVHEIAAIEPSEIDRLMSAAVRIARTAGVSRLSLRAPHNPPVEAALAERGKLETPPNDATMLRRVCADEQTMDEITRIHEHGQVPWWAPDDY